MELELTKLEDTIWNYFSPETEIQHFRTTTTRMMIFQLQDCSAQNNSSWMDFLQFVLSIVIFATAHWIVHENFELLYSWIHPYMTGMKNYLTTSQDRTESRFGGSYGMKNGRLVFCANNQTDVTQQSKEYISQLDDTSHDSSLITSGSTILTHLDVQKMSPRFSWSLKRWKKSMVVKNEEQQKSQSISCHRHRHRHRRYRRVGSSSPLKCNQSKSMKQNSIRSGHQYQRNPATIRNRIENALDRFALWYYVDRRL